MLTSILMAGVVDLQWRVALNDDILEWYLVANDDESRNYLPVCERCYDRIQVVQVQVR